MGAAVDPGIAQASPRPKCAPPRPRRDRAVWFLAISSALVISRWLTAPRYLVTFDEINFALAIDRFNPALHRPQPPGDPLFVALLKLLALGVSPTERVFLLAAMIMSLAALVLLWRGGEFMLGARRGVICALLLLFNPAFWLGALTNPVRLCNAATAAAVALCVWRAVRGNSRRWLPMAAAAAGIGAGFRPESGVMLAPLIIWAGFRARVGWKTAAVTLLSFGAAVATWLPALLMLMGGWRQGWIVLRGYSNAQFNGTSLLFGAPLNAAFHMAWEAIVWSCLGTLSWLWAAPLLARTGRKLDPLLLRFLAWWFLPGLLFYAIVHVGDPDHTLTIVPATCVAGAALLTAVTRRVSPVKTALLVAICVLLNVFLFFKPISKTAKASTIVPGRWVNGYIANMIDGLHAVRGPRPLTVVFDDWNGSWRHLAHYAPDAHVVVIERRAMGRIATRHVIGDRSIERASLAGDAILPACGTVVFVDPVSRPVAGDAKLKTYKSVVYSAAAAAGAWFEFGGVRLVAGQEPCTAAEP